MYLPALMLIRRIIGLICVIIGVIGLIMPIMPGWPFLIPGIALLGSRDPLLRYVHLAIIRLLKFAKTRRTPWIHRNGEHLYEAYKRTRAVVEPLILRTERSLERWMGYPQKRPPEA